MTILAQTGALSWALQYTKYGDGTLVAAKAQSKVVYSGQPSNNNTLVAGGTTYTYKTTLSTGPAVANEIHIGTDLNETIANTVKAIGAGAGAGTAYGTGTVANPDADAVAAYHTIFLTADTAGKAGNSLALSKTGTYCSLVSWSGGLDAGTFDLSTLSYSRHRASDIDYDVVTDQRVFPLEVGSVITPTGVYRAGSYAAGGATILPRLEDVFGELLLALMGSATVAANTPVVGAHTHTFTFNPNAIEDIPWVTIRKHVPGRGNVRPEGIIGIDNKLAQLRLMIPQNDVVQARVDFLGRIPQFDQYSDAWLYANSYENSDKSAFSCKGYFKIPAVSTGELPVTSVIVEMVNNITTPREEMVIGSYNPDDYVTRTRSMVVRFVHKWSDPALYNQIHTGSSTGATWTPTPFVTNYNAGAYAFEARVESVNNVTGTTPYSLTIRAGSVAWEPVGPIRLQGGGILSQEYRGTVLDPDESLGVNYADFLLVNGHSSAYAIPSQP